MTQPVSQTEASRQQKVITCAWLSCSQLKCSGLHDVLYMLIHHGGFPDASCATAQTWIHTGGAMRMCKERLGKSFILYTSLSCNCHIVCFCGTLNEDLQQDIKLTNHDYNYLFICCQNTIDAAAQNLDEHTRRDAGKPQVSIQILERQHDF